MKFVIPTIGSRGDVQPFIALAQGLEGSGNTVTLASHPEGDRPGLGSRDKTVSSTADNLHCRVASSHLVVAALFRLGAQRLIWLHFGGSASWYTSACNPAFC